MIQSAVRTTTDLQATVENYPDGCMNMIRESSGMNIPNKSS